jgi:guanine deaminase
VSAGLFRPVPGVVIEEHRGGLLMPGFVDAHVHSAQTDVIASHAEGLLEWLSRHTFPAEASFADAAHARQASEYFLDECVRHGTTTAAVFPSVHAESVDAFFAAAQARGMRMAAGKVMMDRHCPEEVRDEAERSYEDSRELIARWHGKARLSYAVTPRFAVTSSERQLELAGRLADEHPGVLVQTHLSENREEVRRVAELFPWATDYLHVYEHYGLVRPGALFAHCLHLSASEWQRLAGGTSFSMLRTMHEAHTVAQLRGQRFDALDAFYLTTLGGARALGLQQHIGSFDRGREADFIVLRTDATPLLARRAASASLAERLFLLMKLGDERAVAATYVMGERAQA